MKNTNSTVAAMLVVVCVVYSDASLSMDAPAPRAFEPPPEIFELPNTPPNQPPTVPRTHGIKTHGIKPYMCPRCFQPLPAPRPHRHHTPRRGHRRNADADYPGGAREPVLRGIKCGENGLYTNETGTCCSRIQTNPPSCQPPPLAQRQP
jgi:hypothetical protein